MILQIRVGTLRKVSDTLCAWQEILLKRLEQVHC